MQKNVDISFERSLRVGIEAELMRGAKHFMLVPDNQNARALSQYITRIDTSIIVTVMTSGELNELNKANQSGECSWGTKVTPDAMVICVNRDKCRILSSLNKMQWHSLPSIVIAGDDHLNPTGPIIQSAEASCDVPSHATGYNYAKQHILDALRSLKSRFKEGVIAEMGAFRGGTLLLIRKLMEDMGFRGPRLVGFDTFSGFPPRRRLLDMFAMARYEDRNFEGTRTRLARCGVEVVRGDIVNTAQWLSDKSLLLTFFDTDNYSPAATALPICFERTVPGGFILFDHFFTHGDFNDTIGERIAAQEFFDGRNDVLHISGTGVFIKMP